MELYQKEVFSEFDSFDISLMFPKGTEFLDEISEGSSDDLNNDRGQPWLADSDIILLGDGDMRDVDTPVPDI